MADEDRMLVVRNVLTCMGAKGFPGPPLFSGNLSGYRISERGVRLTVKAILHYTLGLRFGNVCEQNATKTRPKRN